MPRGYRLPSCLTDDDVAAYCILIFMKPWSEIFVALINADYNGTSSSLVIQLTYFAYLEDD